MPIMPFMPLLHFLLLGGVLVSHPLRFSIFTRPSGCFLMNTDYTQLSGRKAYVKQIVVPCWLAIYLTTTISLLYTFVA